MNKGLCEDVGPSTICGNCGEKQCECYPKQFYEKSSDKDMVQDNKQDDKRSVSMKCKQCNEEIDVDITEEEFKENGEICPVCVIRNKMVCIDADPVYDENNTLIIPAGYICCYQCSLYDAPGTCFLQGELKSPVKFRCDEFDDIVAYLE